MTFIRLFYSFFKHSIGYYLVYKNINIHNNHCDGFFEYFEKLTK